MTSNDFSEHLVILRKECLKMNQETSVTGIHTALKTFYRIVKKSTTINEKLSASNVEDHETICFLIKSLVSLLIDDNLPAEVMLLCGTCLSLLICAIDSSESASSFLMCLYCHFHKRYSGKQTIPEELKSKLKKEIIEDVKSFVFHQFVHVPDDFEAYLQLNNSGSLKTPSFQQIAILNGIVSCQVPELYRLHSNLTKKKPFLIYVFALVHECCLSPSLHQYHAFNVLLNWLRTCEGFFHDYRRENDEFFSTNEEITQKTLKLLESNWQSPIKGINGFIKEIYKSIIKLNEKECKKNSTDHEQLIQYMLGRAMMLSWQVKGKYFLLSVLLQHIDYSKFFGENPDAASNIIFSLKANYIASSVAEVYKVVVTNMRKYNSEENLCLEWCKWWREPILKSLCSNDKLLIQNVTNSILPWTMKQFPKSYDLMMESEHCADDSVKLLLLRIVKENFPRTLSVKELTLIDKNLHHSNIQFRTEVLSILCSSPKKSECVKSGELEFIKTFILENLNIDSAPFHQHLLSQLNTLLIRIRDSLTQQYRSKLQNKDCTVDLFQLEFVDWLAHICIQSTFPGACFQRRRLSLQLLNVIYDVFMVSPLGYKRKEKPSKSVEQVIKWAQENDFLLFFKNDMLPYILPCITDFADEIRSLCANLLCKYSSWPSKDNCEAINEEIVTKFALTLCNHPDYRNNDGGAHICCIIFNRLWVQSHGGESNQALDFLKYLISETELQLESAKEDFLSAAINKPIHGMLLALQYCLSSSKSFMIKSYEYDQEKTSNFMKHLMSLCFNVVEYMLKVMKGENENYDCPSFCDIGKAMEKLVLSKKNAVPNIHDNDFGNGESSDCTMLSDLLLSCCWHSIKNSCFVLCEVSSLVLALNIHYDGKKKFLQSISEEFSSILIACRHRGVVEACCEALNKFCVNLLKDKSIHEEITIGLLQQVFESLEDSTKVSVTRRSAGLPLLFQAVVSSEENNINRQLLSYTIENLLKLMKKPLPSPNSISEKTDMPQAHAYHILKALVLDARLSQSILPYFDSIIPVCISAFSSSVWSIRNGALQLFGVILPRICGQKKVRDDDSEHNMVSAFELFARCPNLKGYLHQQLEKCVKFHHERRLCSELVPILSLLVKLMPEQEDQRIFMNDFTLLLLELLNIPVWKVRDLVSLALSLLMSNSEITHLLEDIIDELQSDVIKVNEIHSLLLIVQKFMKRKRENILVNTFYLEEKLKNVYHLLCRKIKCPLLLGIAADMMMSISDAKKDLSILKCIHRSEINCDMSQTQKIGFLFHENITVLADLKTCSSLPEYLKKISSKNKDTKIICLQFLTNKLNAEKSTENFYLEDNLKLWKDILASVLKYTSPEEHPSVIAEALKFMINLCSDCIIRKAVLDSIASSVMEKLEYHLDEESGLSVSAFAFTMWSTCIRAALENPNHCFQQTLEKWSVLFFSHCQPRTTDILRLQAAKSLSILGPSLAKYLASNIGISSNSFSEIFIGLCEGSLLLLQDEDEDIRDEACKFPSQLPHNNQAENLQFNIGIKVVFLYMLQVLHAESFYVMYLWNRLQNYPPTAKVLQSYSSVKKRNLFEQEYINVFAEPHQILLRHQKNLKAVLKELSSKNYSCYQENINMFLCDLEVELQDVFLILSSTDDKNSDQSFTYHHQVYLALKKLRCQVDVLLSQKHSVSTDDSLHGKLKKLSEEWTNIENCLPPVTVWFLNTL